VLKVFGLEVGGCNLFKEGRDETLTGFKDAGAGLSKSESDFDDVDDSLKVFSFNLGLEKADDISSKLFEREFPLGKG